MSDNTDNKYEFEDLDFDLGEYTEKIQVNSSLPKKGILILPYDKWGRFDCSSFMPETFNFLKWIKRNEKIKENISVLDGKEKKIADLRSDQIWFPLVYLFSDVSLPIYLNLVSNYLYEKLRGALSGDKHEVNIEAYVEDKKAKKTKKFFYNGNVQGLKEIMKKIDFDKMMGNK